MNFSLKAVLTPVSLVGSVCSVAVPLSLTTVPNEDKKGASISQLFARGGRRRREEQHLEEGAIQDKWDEKHLSVLVNVFLSKLNKSAPLSDIEDKFMEVKKTGNFGEWQIANLDTQWIHERLDSADQVNQEHLKNSIKRAFEYILQEWQRSQWGSSWSDVYWGTSWRPSRSKHKNVTMVGKLKDKQGILLKVDWKDLSDDYYIVGQYHSEDASMLEKIGILKLGLSKCTNTYGSGEYCQIDKTQAFTPKLKVKMFLQN